MSEFNWMCVTDDCKQAGTEVREDAPLACPKCGCYSIALRVDRDIWALVKPLPQ